MSYSKQKNLLRRKDEYNMYYGDFRGVDFSSDHTQVNSQRLAYSVNMYKDYQSGQGQAIETVPGFRRRFVGLKDDEIYGIHSFVYKNGSSDTLKVLIHAGEKLYLWDNYPLSVNVELTANVYLPEEYDYDDDAKLKIYSVTLPGTVVVTTVVGLFCMDGTALNTGLYEVSGNILKVKGSSLIPRQQLIMKYREGELPTALFSSMNKAKSSAFVMNNRLYIIDGANYIYYDGVDVKKVCDEAFIPTTYINIIPSGTNRDTGTEYAQRNLLQPQFKHTFVADGETTEFYMNENELEEVTEVKVYGVNKTAGTDYTVDATNGKITFKEAPKKPEEVEGDVVYPEGYAGVEITAKKDVGSQRILKCTVCQIYDDRVFLTGNPDYPNELYWCWRNDTGYTDPSYFGILSYMSDGVGNTPNTGMMVVADTLMVLKGDTQQDGSVYYHTPEETGIDLYPKIYPSSKGLNGIGCLGACVNFLDDPIFISRLGVEAIGQLSVRYERAIEHRSSLVDAVLVNLDLRQASLCEWNGYLVILVNGKIFLADNRQMYTHSTGVMQYEWYYLEDIGVYEGQYAEYRYSSRMYPELEGVEVGYCTTCDKGSEECTCASEDRNIIEIPLCIANNVYHPDTVEYRDITGTVANVADSEGKSTAGIYHKSHQYMSENETAFTVELDYTVRKLYDELSKTYLYEAYLLETKGNMTGGVFRPAKIVKSVDENIFFGTENGVVCSFNFDKRGEKGEFAPKHYTFDGRTIYCGVATKMDCCNIPHLTKSTVKKSTVVKTKALASSAAKIKIRTNKKPYQQIARINSSVFSFENLDFSDFSFIPEEQTLFAVKEKEKKWVEKQHFIYSDEYMKPFALFYVAFRYNIAGRYKE